jgi:2-keto-4-pentenoate hydratase/2-oxohepta-3-ene-1,7-dioic acid hydratase in catechol pathway
MRDYQSRTEQWLAGRNRAASTPLGPYLVTPDRVLTEVAGVGRLENPMVAE